MFFFNNLFIFKLNSSILGKKMKKWKIEIWSNLKIELNRKTTILMHWKSLKPFGLSSVFFQQFGLNEFGLNGFDLNRFVIRFGQV